jgi:hypothetical protein
MGDGTLTFRLWCEYGSMCWRGGRPLPESDRKDLAIQALAGSATVSDLAARHGVSRKFVYQQTHKAARRWMTPSRPTMPDDEVLFELAVTKTWLRQVIVGLTLICRSSYRGVVEFLRDLLGVPISLGTVHDVLQAATRQASVINHEPDLSAFGWACTMRSSRVESPCWPASMPIDLLLSPGGGAASRRRHLGRASARRRQRGLRPDYTIADAGQGLRAGQRPPGATRRAMATCSTSSASAKAWPTRCRALPTGATSRRETLQAGIGPRRPAGSRRRACRQLELARQTEAGRFGWPATSERSPSG